jgi:hypothetical protein
MANLLREQRIVDNNKRALIKYVFISDGTAQSNVVLVNVSTLVNALNTNGYIMTSNADPKSIYRTTVKRIFGQAKAAGYYKLQWQGASNSEIITFSSGNFDYDFQSMGDGAVISNPETSSNGKILFSTSGISSGDEFTLFLDLRKNSEDYDAGQTNDPGAFNWGNRGKIV